MGRIRTWFFPILTGEEQGRRLRLFRTLLLVQIGAAVLLVGVILVDTQGYPQYTPWMVGLSLATSLISIGSYFLARRVNYHLGALLLILVLLVFLEFCVGFYGTRGPVPFLLVWPTMVAAILTEPPLTFAIATLAALAYGGLSYAEITQTWTLPIFQTHVDLFGVWHRPSDLFTIRRAINDTVDVIIVFYAVAFLAWLASHSLRQAVEQSRAQAAEIERYRAGLEEQVTARTVELRQTLEQLQASMELIREVGSPILSIYEGVILAPLIGSMDSERAHTVMEQVFNGIARHRARVVIIDITGLPVVDTAVANTLVQTAQGARLLGATPVLVGIRAEVAQTLVGLGVDLQAIVTLASLREGLEYALKALGSEIHRKAPQTLPGLLRARSPKGS